MLPLGSPQDSRPDQATSPICASAFRFTQNLVDDVQQDGMAALQGLTEDSNATRLEHTHCSGNKLVWSHQMVKDGCTEDNVRHTFTNIRLLSVHRYGHAA